MEAEIPPKERRAFEKPEAETIYDFFKISTM